jgi:nucleotide-binding universal stress UspA family protein
MISPRKIVVGIDLSNDAKEALAEAARIAERNNAEITVLRAIPAEIIEASYDFYHTTTDETLERARTALDTLVKEIIPDAAQVRQTVTVGNPTEEIIASVKEFDAELLVLGLRGDSEDLQGAGTIAAKCIHKSPVPVLLTSHRRPLPPKRIAACIDFSGPAALALQTAEKLARIHEATLDVVHIHHPPWLDPWRVSYRLEQIVKPEKQAVYEGKLHDHFTHFMDANLDGIDPHRVKTHLIAHRNSAYGILNFLEDQKVDLAIMGSHGKTGVQGLLTGSTSEKVMHHTPCSLFVIRPPAGN